MPGKCKIFDRNLHAAGGNALEQFEGVRKARASLDEPASESDCNRAEVGLILNGDILETLKAPHLAWPTPRLIPVFEDCHAWLFGLSVYALARAEPADRNEG